MQCDERKPTCFRCQKSKRECTGYRNQLFLRRLGSGKGDTVNWSQIPNSKKENYYSGDWSQALSRVTYRSASPPETTILSPPTFGISTSIEEEALCHFIDSFILLPCKGNSRSYMDFIIPAMKDEKSLVSPSNSLSTAVMAVALASFGNRKKVQLVLPKAAKQYAKALQQINEALLDPDLALEDQTLATVLILGLFEVYILQEISHSILTDNTGIYWN
jgi:Fungal specific transcription factor domain/Fungal Zn(2)-Cys(6) binuclear cluster domain